jgi:hypothetical protein
MFVSEYDPCSRDEFRKGLTTLEKEGSVLLVTGDVADDGFEHMSAQFFGDPALDRIPFIGSPDAEPDFDHRLADAGYEPDNATDYYSLGLTDPDCETVRNRLNRSLWLHSSPDDVEPGTIRVGLELTSLLETANPDTVVETLAGIRDLSKEFHAMIHLIYRDSLETLLQTLDDGELDTALDLIVLFRESDSENPEQQWVLLEQECTSDWIDPSSVLGR